MNKVRIKLLSEGARMPEKAHSGDAGFDVFLPKDTVIYPGRQRIPLDFAIELPEWHQAQVEPKSGNSTYGIEGYLYLFENPQTGDKERGTIKRFNMDVIHGKIDSNYRGNVCVIVNSYEDRPFHLERGTKIAQMTIYELPHIDGFEQTETLSATDRGDNGFGSSGSMYKPSINPLNK